MSGALGRRGTLTWMGKDPGTIVLELTEARAGHGALLKQMSMRMRELDDLWRTAKPADRLLAVQRLLQTGALSKKHTADLETKNERVRELMGKARNEKKKLERTSGDGVATHEQQHRVFRMELDAQRAEQERDELVDELNLRGPLYFCGETFVRTDPFGVGELPLKDMAAKAQGLEQKIAELEKLDRKGVRFTKTTADGREQTLIRMLPALTAEGDAHLGDVSDDELPLVGPDAGLDDNTDIG